jgi:hypothetical protein
MIKFLYTSAYNVEYIGYDSSRNIQRDAKMYQNVIIPYSYEAQHLYICTVHVVTFNLHGLSQRTNYTDRAAAAGRRS